MKKKAWILTYKTNDLVSVENISAGLVELYKETVDAKIISLSDEETVSSSELRNLISEFKINSPDVVAVVHPSVNYHTFFQSLFLLSKKTQFLIHVFGNFVRNGAAWYQQSHLYEGKDVQFVMASECYVQLLKNFVSEENIALLPFPVIHSGSDEKRENKNEIRFLYAGRFHHQKNISQLIAILNEAAILIDKPIVLNLVGTFDDFNPSTLNCRKMLGEQFSELQKAAKAAGRIKVHFHPHVRKTDLLHHYESNDIFISFSTFQDEDYGCSVIEALSAGTPAIVTAWGGYKDFIRDFPAECLSINVELQQNSLVADFSSLPQLIQKLTEKRNQSRTLAERVMKKYGMINLSDTLSSLLKKKVQFKGFDKSLAQPMTVESYKKLYSAFWTEKK